MNKINWKKILIIDAVILVVLVGGWWYWTLTQGGGAEWLALVTYTNETEDGVAIVDLNPNADSFGNMVQKFSMGAGVVPHHLYFSPDGKRLFTTSLAGAGLYELTLNGNKLSGFESVDTGTCALGENLYFNEDNTRIYLTCMGSDEVVMLEQATLNREGSIQVSNTSQPDAYVRYPHGMAVNPALDRMLVTETISADLTDPGSRISVIEYSTGKVLGTHRLEKVPGAPSGPVEVLFSPTHPVAYVTGMFDASIWIALWDNSTSEFEFSLIDDPAVRGHTWPLEMYLGPEGHLYISYAQPGVIDVYSLDNPQQPQYMRTLPAEPGAHHQLFTKDGKYGFSQNNLLGLEQMNAGTITVVDLTTDAMVAKFDMLKETELMPTSMVWLNQP